MTHGEKGFDTNLKKAVNNITVTQKNKGEYVELYIDYVMNSSVSKWFNSFKKGFINC
jgi:hypothetical protein